MKEFIAAFKEMFSDETHRKAMDWLYCWFFQDKEC